MSDQNDGCSNAIAWVILILVLIIFGPWIWENVLAPFFLGVIKFIEFVLNLIIVIAIAVVLIALIIISFWVWVVKKLFKTFFWLALIIGLIQTFIVIVIVLGAINEIQKIIEKFW